MPSSGPRAFIWVTVPTTRSLHTRSLRFPIFWEILENGQLKTLLNTKILQIVTVFDNTNRNDLVVGTVVNSFSVFSSIKFYIRVTIWISIL